MFTSKPAQKEDTFMHKPIALPAEFHSFTEEEFKKLLRLIDTLTDSKGDIMKLLSVARFFNFPKTIEVLQCSLRIAQIKDFTPRHLLSYIDVEKEILLDNINFFYGPEVMERVKAKL